MKAPNQLFISNEWVDSSSGEKTEIINPATEEVIDTVAMASQKDLEKAEADAMQGYQQWKETDAWTRSRLLSRMADWLRKNSEDIAITLTQEQGKPLSEARAEVHASAEQYEWYSGEALRIYGRIVEAHSKEHRILVLRQPVGPVAAFSPWNFPIMLTARKIGPALAAGCSVIVKPPIEAPRSPLFLAQAAKEAGLPSGVLSMVPGNPPFVSRHLIDSPVIRKVSLTGSVPVGRELARLCAEKLKPISLELGGHSAVLVFEDADIEDAAEKCARGKYRNNGQVCISASRFFVQESVLSKFIKKFTEITRSLKIGNGKDPGVDIGPLSNRKRQDCAQALVADAVSKGARIEYGGFVPKEFSKGYYYMPTVLTGIREDMTIMHEEPFCPIAPITSFQNLEDGLSKANCTSFGLAGYVFTKSTKTAFLAAERLDCGMVGVNNLVISTPEAPFGGVKQSGMGREGGTEWIEAYTTAKYINIRLE